jgi:alanyl aminopeptidase
MPSTRHDRSSRLPLACVASLMLLDLACRHGSAPPRAGSPGASGAMTSAEASAAALVPPALRLPDHVRPQRQAVSLRISPNEPAFSGSTDITLDVRVATSVIWLHAAELAITGAELRGGAAPLPLTPASKGEFLALVAARPIAAGHVSLHVTFTGKMATRDDRGLYRQEDGSDWYAFTQFEASDARRAFPCFDEPSFKIPWQLTLEIPGPNLGFANTAQVSQHPAADGWKQVVFAETKPVPAYLVAFAVGPFEIVDGGKAGKRPTQVRIIVPRGKAGQVAYAARTTGETLARLENYLGMPYPFDKLDHVAVPMKGGAMENPGLVTFGTDTIYAKPGERDIALERGYLHIAAHELGHMWFGDLVTTAWWDDLWLNEAFASWIDSKVVDAWHPEWAGQVLRVQARSGAMNQDALISARRIRQPIESQHDVENAFDAITYEKGSAIIAMFESYVGEAPFAAGLRNYLGRHAHGNATAADLLQDIGAVVGDADTFARAFSTFLDQPGVPLLGAELRCAPDQPPRLLVTQQRYLPLGSPGAVAPAAQRWDIPVCVRLPQGRVCTLVKTAQATIDLPGKTCPAWVLANADSRGYYRVQYQGDLLQRLLRDGGKALTVPERLGLLGDVGALVRSARLPYGEALGLAPGLAKDENRHILANVASLVGGVSDNFVSDELRPRYRRFITRTFGEHARKLGWMPRAADSDDTRLLRPTLLALLVDEAEDPALQKSARGLAVKWLTDRSAVAPEMIGLVLVAAAQHGDRALWNQFHAAAKAENDEMDRERLLTGLGSFLDPELVAANFGVALSKDFDPRESFSLVWRASNDRRTRQLAYDFVKQHFDDIIARMPLDFAARLPQVGRGFCDVEHRRDLEAFFTERSARARGGPRALAQTLERVDLCIALRAAQQASVSDFLQKQ